MPQLLSFRGTVLRHSVLSWPEDSFCFFYKMLWENLSDFFWPTQYIVWQRLESQLLATASSKMQSLLAFLLPCSLFLFFHLPNKLSVTKSLFQSLLLSLRAVILLGKWTWATFAQHFKLKRYNCLRTPNCHSYMIDWKATFLSIKF